MILRTYVVFSPRRPLLFLLTSKWLIYKVESYDEVQNLKSCTFSLRSSSPLNEEARKAWLGTTTSNVSLSLWAGSAFLIALIKFLTIQRHHTSLPVVPPLHIYIDETFMRELFIGASLSEPHIDETFMRELFIYIYVCMVRPSPAAPLIHITLCAFQNIPRSTDRMS